MNQKEIRDLGHELHGYDSGTCIAIGLYEVAQAIRYAARELGNGGAATPMGAIEGFGVTMRDGLADLSRAVANMGERIHEKSFHEVANAISDLDTTFTDLVSVLADPKEGK